MSSVDDQFFWQDLSDASDGLATSESSDEKASQEATTSDSTQLEIRTEEIRKNLLAELSIEQEQAVKEATRKGFEHGSKQALEQVSQQLHTQIQQSLDQLRDQVEAIPQQLIESVAFRQWMLQALEKLTLGVLHTELEIGKDSLFALVEELMSQVRYPDVAVELVATDPLYGWLTEEAGRLPEHIKLSRGDQLAWLELRCKAAVVTYDPESAIKQALQEWRVAIDASS